MLNKESEYTYVTSKDADVENGDFGKNVGVGIDTEKMSIRHGGLDKGRVTVEPLTVEGA